jgi:hypothetical protein
MSFGFNPLCSTAFNPLMSGFNPLMSGFPMQSGLGQQQILGAQQQELVSDLLHDRHRDMRNLSLVNDLLDVRRMETDQLIARFGQSGLARQPWIQQICHENRQIENTIKSLLRDAKYNRRADEIIANVSLGRPHLRRPDEMIQNICDLKYDVLAKQTAHQLMAQKASRVLECQAQFGQNIGAGAFGISPWIGSGVGAIGGQGIMGGLGAIGGQGIYGLGSVGEVGIGAGSMWA